jgi:hypothetical protein
VGYHDKIGTTEGMGIPSGSGLYFDADNMAARVMANIDGALSQDAGNEAYQYSDLFFDWMADSKDPFGGIYPGAMEIAGFGDNIYDPGELGATVIPTERIVTENGKPLMMLTPGFALVGGAGYGTGLELGLSMPEGTLNYLAGNATGMKNSGLELINSTGIKVGSEVGERVLNKSIGLGYRTKSEIAVDLDLKYLAVQFVGKNGDIICFGGSGVFDGVGNVIKFGTMAEMCTSPFRSIHDLSSPLGFINGLAMGAGLMPASRMVSCHVGELREVDGQLWVLEMGDNGPQCNRSLSDIVAELKLTGGDMEIYRHEGGREASDYMFKKFFDEKRNPRPNNPSYNYLNTLAFNSKASENGKSYICSRWVVEGMNATRTILKLDHDILPSLNRAAPRISPLDLQNALINEGLNIKDIYKKWVKQNEN